ncbi:hypothetical protein V2J09_000755 [Rumex salicifolius]
MTDAQGAQPPQHMEVTLSPNNYPNRPHQPSKLVVIADLNDRSGLPCKESHDAAEAEGKKLYKLGKCRARIKLEDNLGGVDIDADQHSQGTTSSREEKVSSLKTGLVHVSRKAPKNAHAHFLLGLMYQRLGQPLKAVISYEKAAEILLRTDEEIDRPELLSMVQIHHAQCILLESLGDCSMSKELEPEEMEEIISSLKESILSDIRQTTLWNTLGVILLRTGRLQNAISVFSSLLNLVPDNLDCLGNLGLSYLQSGDFEAALKCLQELLLKDQSHPSAFMNYSAVILSKYGSVIAGAGASAAEDVSEQILAANVAKDLLLAGVEADPKASHIWANLANAFCIIGDHRSSGKCLEKAAKMEPNCMPIRYAVAVHRIKDAERSQTSEQLPWAGNEMASVLKEGDTSLIDSPIAWTGLAMAHKSQHELAAVYETEKNELAEMEDRAAYTLKQAVGEDPDDALQWLQLGLHSLCTQQFKMSQKFLMAAVARFKECSCAWSNLGVSLQLTEEPLKAKEVLKRALSLSTPQQAHAILSNIGNLYRQKGQYNSAKAMFTQSLKLQPGYAPAYNNLGLVFVAEAKFDEAKFCFNKALLTDPLLDAAKSNLLKVVALSRICTSLQSD